jgi:hypothetical protein
MCALLGIAAAAVSRGLMSATGLAQRLPFQLAVNLAIGTLFGLGLWMASAGVATMEAQGLSTHHGRVIALAIAALAVLAWLGVSHLNRLSTDDATIDAEVVHVAPPQGALWPARAREPGRAQGRSAFASTRSPTRTPGRGPGQCRSGPGRTDSHVWSRRASRAPARPRRKRRRAETNLALAARRLNSVWHRWSAKGSSSSNWTRPRWRRGMPHISRQACEQEQAAHQSVGSDAGTSGGPPPRRWRTLGGRCWTPRCEPARTAA